MAKKASKEKRDLIDRAKKCLEKFQERESDNITRAEEAIRFRALEQWPQAIKQDRERPGQDGGPRPCPVLDKTNQYVRQVVNEERKNRAAIRVRPVDDHGDKEVAEVFMGIIRHVEDASQAIEAYTTAGEHAIDGGFGYWRVLTEYCDEMSFDQDIRIKRIPNRFSVALGPHVEPDGSDAKEGLIWEDIDRETFKSMYPDAQEVDFDDSDGWGDKETVRVAEYMCIKPKSTTIYLTDNGQVLTEEEREKGTKIVKERKTTINKVKWYKMTAAEILEETDIIGKWIPIVKVVGNELYMPDGKCRLSGMIESMMDPQRLHNYAHAGFIEQVALAPRAPWVAEENQIAGYEDDYSNANRRNIVVLKYKSTSTDDGHLVPPPQRVAPPGISTGWQQMLMNTQQGVEAAAGMYGPTIGAQSQEKSGIALMEQKEQGMVGNFHFPDNLARSIQHTGRILVEWIPKVYDTERVARILGEDGEEDLRYLNPDQEQAVMPRMDEFGEQVGSIYNLNVGKYDVTVSTGPSYSSKRQEAADNQIQLVNARPELLNIIGDIMFRNMDWPGADEIADRLKALLPPELRDVEGKDGKKMDPEVMQMVNQVKQMSQALAETEQQLQQRAQEIEGERAEVDMTKTETSAAQKVLNADRMRLRAELELIGSKIERRVEEILQGQVPPEVLAELNGLVTAFQDQINPL